MPLLLTPLMTMLLILLWVTGADPAITAGWSAVALLYFLFAAPTDCVVLDAYRLRCRAPAGGLLRACVSQAHRRKARQRFLRVARGSGWCRSRLAEFASSPRNLLTSAGAAVSFTSGLFATVARVL